MLQFFKFLGFVLWLFAAATALPAQANAGLCQEIEQLKDWSFYGDKFTLAAKDLLPADYLEQVKAEIGPVELSMNHTLYGEIPTIEFWCHAKGQTIAEFVLQKGESSVILHGLRASNPLAVQAGETTRVKLEQKAPGLPPPVFAHAKRRILELVKRSATPRLEALGCQNFSVLMLYTKGVGMIPKTPLAEKTIAMLNSHYQFARKQLPEEFRPKSVQDFTAMLGGTNFQRQTEVHIANFRKYREGDKSGVKREFFDKNGSLVAVEILGAEGKSQISFIDTTVPQPSLLEWSRLADRGGTSLILELEPPAEG